MVDICGLTDICTWHNDQVRRHPVRRIIAIVLGLAVLCGSGWVGYQYWFSDLINTELAAKTTVELQAGWVKKAGMSGRLNSVHHIAQGEAFALLRIPRFGRDWQWPIKKGVTSISSGVAWDSFSSEPGKIGNCVIAGQRVGQGSPFRRLLELKAGDEVVIENQEAIYSYKLLNEPHHLTVDRDASWVLDPVPGKPDVVAWQPMITLTSAQDLLPSRDRSVGFGVLTSTQKKDAKK